MLCVHTLLNGCLTQDILPQESVKVLRRRAPQPPSYCSGCILTKESSSTMGSSNTRNIHLIDWNSTGGSCQLEKRRFLNTLMGFFKICVPEHTDKYWLCSVLSRVSRCCLIHQSVFWCQGIDRGGRHINSDTAPSVRGREGILVISSHCNDIMARPYAPKWISSGQKVGKWLLRSQSIALLQ